MSAAHFPFTKINKDRVETPIFLAHGKFDTMIPYELAKESYKILLDKKNKDYGFTNVEFSDYDMDHSIHPNELAKLME